MEVITKNKIKRFILDSSNDVEDLLEFLETDSDEVVTGMIEALFILMKLYDQNKEKTDYLINLLDQLIEIKTTEELKEINSHLIELDNKIKLLKLKQRIKITQPYQKLKQLIETINQKTYQESYDGKLKYLEYLIFQNRDKELINDYLNNSIELLDKKNDDEEDIFSIILGHYLNLDERKEKEIDYFYQVILIFLASIHGEVILKNKEHYYKLIKESKLGYKNHIINVIRLFDPRYQVPEEELEDQYGIKFQFPNIILSEMYTFNMTNHHRRNFLYQDCLTIDGEKAKCLDDACYIEKNLDGTYTLYIHIVDIPAFIPYHSLLNEEARNRVKTYYLKDNTIPLYPEYIGDQMCSLLPHNNRNVITFIIKLNSNFQVLENTFEITLGKIKSTHRLTYETADRILRTPSDDELHNQLIWLASFANERRKANSKKEEYRQFENLINLETSHESLKIDYSDSANIVHESMVFVNYMSAKFFKELALPYIYRKLELPSNDYIEQQLHHIKQLDSKITEDKELIRRLRESNIEALYCSKPIYHKGLKMECYSHSSSPARRYPDAFNQYIIHDLLINNHLDDTNIYIWEYRINELVKYINKREKELESFSSQYNYLAYRNYIKIKKK